MSVKLNLVLCGVLFALAAIGCGPKQPEFDALHPVTGKITYGGKAPGGGVVQFKPVIDKDEFHVNSVVDPEGNFKLTTVRTTDTRGERREGAPAGEYTVIFIPPNQDQTVSFDPPVTLPMKVTIEAKDNVLTLDAAKP